MAQQQQIRVDMKDLKDIRCTCKNDCFIGVTKFKIIPLLYSQTGKEELLAINCMKCTTCGEVYTPEDLMNLKQVFVQ
jgi:hypothetical protein